MKDQQTYDAAQTLMTDLAKLERAWRDAGVKAGIGFYIDDESGTANIWVEPSVGPPALRLSVRSDVFRVLIGDHGEEDEG